MQIVLNADLSMDVYIINKHVMMFNQLRTHLDVQVAINKIAQMKVCIGGPSLIYYKSVMPRCAYEDITGHWRHHSCCIVISNGTICKNCANLDKILRRYVGRKKYVKAHVPLSPSKKKKFDMLKKVIRIQNQCIKRKKITIKRIREKIEELKERMSTTEFKNIEDYLNQFDENIPNAQVSYFSVIPNQN